MNSRDDVEKIRAQTDLLSVYATLTGMAVEQRRQQVVMCPFHDDGTPSFSLNASKGVWHCFGGCGSGDVFELIRRLLKCSFPDAVRWAAEHVGSLPPPMAKREYINDDNINYLPDTIVQGYQARMRSVSAEGYYLSRGITYESISLYRLGYGVPIRSSCRWERYAIPYIDWEGKVRTIKFRKDIEEDTYPKYLCPRGVNGYLFGVNGLAEIARKNYAGGTHIATPRVVVLCGGAFDAIILMQMGIPAVASPGESAFSHRLSEELSHIGVKQIITLFDADDGGEKGRRQVDRTSGSLIVRHAKFPTSVPEGSDVNSLSLSGWTKQDFTRIIDNAISGTI